MLQITPRPLDHRIAIGALRGLSADAIGDRLDLPTEYVERRIAATYGMPVTAPGIPSTIPNRILAVLQEANGEPVTLDALMAVYDVDDEPCVGSIKQAIYKLRRRGHVIKATCRYVLVSGSVDQAARSEKLLAIMTHLKRVMASRRELNAVTGCDRAHDINVYVHRLRERGAVIERHSTYVLQNTQVLS